MFFIILKIELKKLLNGQWIESESGKYIDINSPLDGSLLGRVPAMSKEEVDLAIEGCKEAQEDFGQGVIYYSIKSLYNTFRLRNDFIMILSKFRIYKMLVVEVCYGIRDNKKIGYIRNGNRSDFRGGEDLFN